jgi:alkylation response protein AidB-like acyl-CoA dehydrogenase
VSLTTLMNERTAIGGGVSKRGSGAIGAAVDLWTGLDPSMKSAARREELMKLWCRSEAARLTNARASAKAKVGNPGPEGSIGKLSMAELNQEIFSMCVDLLGPAGTVGYDFTFRRPDVLDSDGLSHGVRHAFLRARANSIEGGTSEIMRNILGEQVLGLPGEPRVDKDLPWSKVLKN